jgi:DNA-binding transcriptional regulator YdaS (Cro superfamily)
MPRVDFDQLPDDARLWIFPAERPLSESEQAQLLGVVDPFIDQWGAHAVPLTAGREIRYDQFLFVAVDQRHVGPSGCSIDALFRQTKVLEQQMGVEFADHAPVLFRQGSLIERVPRDEFAQLAATGSVTLETTVFDNTLTSVGDVRAGRWETRLAQAWHARAFFSV